MKVWFVLILFILLIACAPTPTPTLIPTPLMTSVAISAPTLSRVPTATEAPTATATNTATPTGTATITHTPTNTRTHTSAIPEWQYTNTAIMQTLAAKPTRTQTPRPLGLRDFANKRGLEIGTQIVNSMLRYAPYRNTAATEFNLAIIDGELHWNLAAPPFRPDRTHYNFAYADRVVDFARANGMEVQAHHLVWGYDMFLPEWLVKGNFSRDDLLAILHENIQTILKHYQGRVSEYVVVNEAFTPSGYVQNFWYNNLGPDYIEMSFRWAREADPNAILIYSDFDAEVIDDKSNRIYEMVKDFKARGVPIDGIGMQMHWLNPAYQTNGIPSKQEVIANMKRFGELGVKIYVTEFDVNLANVQGTQQQRRNYEAQVYKEMVEACLESEVCKSFSMFGFTDAMSWYTISSCPGCFGDPNAEPLVFDKDYKPKPAYFAVRDALLGK